MSKFPGSTSKAPGVSKKKKFGGSTTNAPGVTVTKTNTSKSKPKRKTLSDGRVRTVRTNKEGRKVVRVRSAGGALLKIRKGATDSKKAVTKTLSGGRYVSKITKGSGADRKAVSYKGKLRSKYRGSGQGVNQGKGVATRAVKGSYRSGNRVAKTFKPQTTGNRYVSQLRKTKRTKTKVTKK